MYYDVFNGDADGICALHQLRLAEPRPTAELVTGVKRDIRLLHGLPGRDDLPGGGLLNRLPGGYRGRFPLLPGQHHEYDTAHHDYGKGEDQEKQLSFHDESPTWRSFVRFFTLLTGTGNGQAHLFKKITGTPVA